MTENINNPKKHLKKAFQSPAVSKIVDDLYKEESGDNKHVGNKLLPHQSNGVKRSLSDAEYENIFDAVITVFNSEGCKCNTGENIINEKKIESERADVESVACEHSIDACLMNNSSDVDKWNLPLQPLLLEICSPQKNELGELQEDTYDCSARITDTKDSSQHKKYKRKRKTVHHESNFKCDHESKTLDFSISPSVIFEDIKEKCKTNKDISEVKEEKELLEIEKSLPAETGTWVQCCITACSKWRYLCDVHDPGLVPDIWYCEMHPDERYNSCSQAEQEYNDSDHIFTQFTLGSIVWARLDGFPWWPAIVDVDPDYDIYCELESEESVVPTDFHVVFLDESVTRAWVKRNRIKKFQLDHLVSSSTFLRGHRFKKDVGVAAKKAEHALSMALQAVEQEEKPCDEVETERLRNFGFAVSFQKRIKRPKPSVKTKHKIGENKLKKINKECSEKMSDLSSVKVKKNVATSDVIINNVKEDNCYGADTDIKLVSLCENVQHQESRRLRRKSLNVISETKSGMLSEGKISSHMEHGSLRKRRLSSKRTDNANESSVKGRKKFACHTSKIGCLQADQLLDVKTREDISKENDEQQQLTDNSNSSINDNASTVVETVTSSAIQNVPISKSENTKHVTDSTGSILQRSGCRLETKTDVPGKRIASSVLDSFSHVNTVQPNDDLSPNLASELPSTSTVKESSVSIYMEMDNTSIALSGVTSSDIEKAELLLPSVLSTTSPTASNMSVGNGNKTRCRQKVDIPADMTEINILEDVNDCMVQAKVTNAKKMGNQKMKGAEHANTGSKRKIAGSKFQVPAKPLVGGKRLESNSLVDCFPSEEMSLTCKPGYFDDSSAVSMSDACKDNQSNVIGRNGGQEANTNIFEVGDEVSQRETRNCIDQLPVSMADSDDDFDQLDLEMFDKVSEVVDVKPDDKDGKFAGSDCDSDCLDWDIDFSQHIVHKLPDVSGILSQQRLSQASDVLIEE